MSTKAVLRRYELSKHAEEFFSLVGLVSSLGLASHVGLPRP